MVQCQICCCPPWLSRRLTKGHPEQHDAGGAIQAWRKVEDVNRKPPVVVSGGKHVSDHTFRSSAAPMFMLISHSSDPLWPIISLDPAHESDGNRRRPLCGR